MRNQVNFFSIQAAKVIMLFWIMPQNTLGQSVCMMFTFDLFDVLILIPGGGGRHCYIVLVLLKINFLKTLI